MAKSLFEELGGKVIYTNLLTSGRLNAYLVDVDKQAQERFERLIEGMKQAQGITEQRKRKMVEIIVEALILIMRKHMYI